MMLGEIRKVVLSAHVVASVGWFGAVAGFLALAISGLLSADLQIVRAAYVAMDITTRCAIVPLCFASLLTGIASSLATTWGLFRHYWVIAKLVLTALSTFFLMVHVGPIARLANAASTMALSGNDLRSDRINVIGAAAAAMLALVISTVLSLYKPRGMTRGGWRDMYSEGTD